MWSWIYSIESYSSPQLYIMTCDKHLIFKCGGDYRNALRLSVRPTIRQSVRPSVTFSVHAVTYVCIDGLPSNLVQMLSWLRQCAVTLNRIHDSKVKVTQDKTTCISYSHSWPVVVYTFGQVQRTSQVERKTKCSKKNNSGGYSVLWTAL